MAIIHPTIGGIQQSDGSLLSIGTMADGQVPVRSGSQLIGQQAMDVVGGRLTMTDATHLRYAFVTSNQIRLHDGTNWRVRNLTSEITKLNTDTDVAGTALAVDKVYDVFALDTGSTTSADIAFARWRSVSERFEKYASGTSYSKGDRVNVDNNSYSSSFTQALDTNSGDNSGYTFRTVVPGSSLSVAGEYIKVELTTASDLDATLAHVTIGESDAYGNIVNAFGTAQFKELLFSGAAGCTITQGVPKTSDALQFRIDPKKYYTIITDITSGGYRRKSSTAVNLYYKASTASYNTPSLFGTTLVAGQCSFLSSITVSAATHYVSVANSNSGITPGTDSSKWASLGLVPANYDFAGLYIQEGIPVLGPSNATLDGRKYRWLGVIYTFNNTAVNFKDDDTHLLVSNFYNRRARTGYQAASGGGATYSSSTWTIWPNGVSPQIMVVDCITAKYVPIPTNMATSGATTGWMEGAIWLNGGFVIQAQGTVGIPTIGASALQSLGAKTITLSPGYNYFDVYRHGDGSTTFYYYTGSQSLEVLP
jgi:hypothetical protein